MVKAKSANMIAREAAEYLTEVRQDNPTSPPHPTITTRVDSAPGGLVTHRAANSAAHLLARDAKPLSERVIWVKDTPPIIAKEILNDVIHLDLGPV